MSNLPTLFTDGVLEAHVRHGMVRVTLGQTGADGKGVPNGQLVLPLVQLPLMLTSLAKLMQELEARARQASAGAQSPAAAQEAAPLPAPGESPVPGGAFRFTSE